MLPGTNDRAIGITGMKDLIRFSGYAIATLVVILLLIEATRSGLSDNTIIFLAIFLVIVLPLAIGIFMARREKRGT